MSLIKESNVLSIAENRKSQYRRDDFTCLHRAKEFCRAMFCLLAILSYLCVRRALCAAFQLRGKDIVF